MFGTSLTEKLLQTNDCTRNSRKNAIVLRPYRAIASHELLYELLRQQTTIAATPLAESTPSPNSQEMRGSEKSTFLVWVVLILSVALVLEKFHHRTLQVYHATQRTELY